MHTSPPPWCTTLGAVSKKAFATTTIKKINCPVLNFLVVAFVIQM